MSAKNELLKMIDERYHKFSKGQKKLADFIREDYDKAAFLTAAKMGGEDEAEFHPAYGSDVWTDQPGGDSDIGSAFGY